MSDSRRPARRLFGLILALAGLTPSATGQITPQGVSTWSSTGLGAAAYSLAIAPGNPNVVYAGSGGGVFKSTDGGASWRNAALPGDATVALVIDGANPNVVYAATAFTNFCHHSYRRLFKSTDGGANWSDSVSPPINGCDNIHALVSSPTDPNTLFVANYDDMFGDTWSPLIKSNDGGASWRGLPAPPLAALAIDPHQPSTLYAGTFDLTYFGFEGSDSRNGVLKSTDGGASWSSTGLTNTAVEALVIDPNNPSTLYAATRGFYRDPRGFRGLFKSTDGGASWSASNNGLAHLIGADPGRQWPPTIARTSLVIDPDNTSTLYMGLPGRGVFKSVDSGANWSPFYDGLSNSDVRALALAPGNPNTLYAATPGGVSKIIDNTPAANPVDDPVDFVRQHYRDFLGREADPEGLAFWANVITSCGSDAQCREVRRVNTSAAFYLSIEFQNTSYLAVRLHKASFGTLPRFQPFLRDARAITQGVVVNAPGWEEKLEANKQAFADQWVSRPEFRALYDSKSNEQYVDALFASAEVMPAQADREALVNGLNGGAETRATVLRKVADNGAVYNRQYNSAFVLMQYFGYLRRNPDDPPDGNMSGYDFWLRKLDFFSRPEEDVRDERVALARASRAEMVRAFITSLEYRGRFGQP